MKDFIEIHDANDDGCVLLVNTKNISYVVKRENDCYVNINTYEPNATYLGETYYQNKGVKMKETYEEIKSLLN